MIMLRSRRITTLTLHALAVLAATLPVSHALAQAAPTPSVTRTPETWIGYAIVFGLFVIVVAVSLMPSKRSHQD
jgi:hypothetical protein